MATKEQQAKIREWQKANTESILIMPRADLHIKDRTEQAVKLGKASSRQAYIIAAIEAQLQKDGILPADDAPADSTTATEQ